MELTAAIAALKTLIDAAIGARTLTQQPVDGAVGASDRVGQFGDGPVEAGLRSFLVEQQRVNLVVLDALRAASQELDDLRARVEELEGAGWE